jgi:hypothetical protein
MAVRTRSRTRPARITNGLHFMVGTSFFTLGAVKNQYTSFVRPAPTHYHTGRATEPSDDASSPGWLRQAALEKRAVVCQAVPSLRAPAPGPLRPTPPPSFPRPQARGVAKSPQRVIPPSIHEGVGCGDGKIGSPPGVQGPGRAREWGVGAGARESRNVGRRWHHRNLR